MGHIKESSDVVPVGVRVAFAGDVEPLRSLDIGRMAQNQMPRAVTVFGVQCGS